MRVDSLFESDDKPPRVIHWEFQSENDSELPFRMAAYSLRVFERLRLLPEQFCALPLQTHCGTKREREIPGPCQTASRYRPRWRPLPWFLKPSRFREAEAQSKAAVVVLDASAYQELCDRTDELEALAGVKGGLKDVADGRVTP